MAITIRNEKTIERIDTLLSNNGHRTKTGVIDDIVRRYPHLVSDLKFANKKIRELENQLYEMKKVVKNKAGADRDFAELCGKLEKEFI